MADREAARAQVQDEAYTAYAGQATKEDGVTAGDLTKLADLRDQGVISDADYERGKEKILHQSAA
jgi:hypothetical protein